MLGDSNTTTETAANQSADTTLATTDDSNFTIDSIGNQVIGSSSTTEHDSDTVAFSSDNHTIHSTKHHFRSGSGIAVPRYACLVAVVLAIPSVSARAQDNPFKAARVGDWVEFKLSNTLSEPTGDGGSRTSTVEGMLRMTLSAKDEKLATVKVVLTVGKAESNHELQIDLSKPFDVAQTPLAEPNAKAEITREKIKEGSETIAAAGKEYATTFTRTRVAIKQTKDPVISEVAVWASKEAPLSGLVKVETKFPGGEMIMLLTAFGELKK